MDDADDGLSPQELFEKTGNDPAAWVSRAEALLSSADVLRGQYPEVPKEDPDAFWEVFKFHTVAMMLRGMAVESLLKAIWLARVSSLAVDGKFRSIPGTKDHDLLSLLKVVKDHVDIGLSREGVELLPMLSSAITSGRYPVNRSLDRRLTKPEWVEKVHWCEWRIPEYDARFLSVVTKLLRLISNDAQPEPPAQGTE
jgi:HEPN domain-containing protein